MNVMKRIAVANMVFL